MVHNNRVELHITKEHIGKNHYQNKPLAELSSTRQHLEPLSAREPQKQAHPSKATRIGQGYDIYKKKTFLKEVPSLLSLIFKQNYLR